MRNKLLAGIAALAIGIGVASCGENEEPASKQSSSKAPEAQQTPSTQVEQPGAEKQAKQSAPAAPEGQPSGQTASQAPAGQEKQPESGQQQSQQEPRPQVAQQEQQPSTTQGQPPQQNTSGPSQSSAQSQTGPAVGQPQPNQLGQNQQATATSAAGPVNLTREELQQAQTLLKKKGFDVGDVDGVLGPRTRRAVMAFQRQRGLEPSGQIDQQTATALGLSIASTSGSSVTGPQ
jgi:hypothetical protein